MSNAPAVVYEIGTRLRTSSQLVSKNYQRSDGSLIETPSPDILRGLDGASAVSMLLEVLGEISPQDAWEDARHEMLLYAMSNPGDRPGLMLGWSGIGLAMMWIAQRSGGYNKAIERIRSAVARHVLTTLGTGPFSIASSHEYEWLHGFAGMLPLLVGDDRYVEASSAVIRLFRWLFVNSGIARWKLPNHNTTGEVDAFNMLGVSHGLAGPLAALLICNLPEAKGAARNIADFLVEHAAWKFGVPQWCYGLANQPAAEYENGVYGRVAWCHGTLGIASCLIAASRVLDEPLYAEIASNSLEFLAATETRYWHMEDMGLCHGYAGAAILLRRASIELRSATLYAKAKEFETTLRAAFRPDLLLGYETTVPGNQFADAGFFTGVSGIGLTLLTFDGIVDDGWLSLLGMPPLNQLRSEPDPSHSK